jgi:integrase/recombinase XerD
MDEEIETFIRYLAVERGLSENYQLSTERSLGEFARWCAERKQITRAQGVGLPLISEYLAERKRGGLSASSIKLIVVALKVFFRFATARGWVTKDPTDSLVLPRIERYLPETLNELQIEQLLESVDAKAPLGLRDRAMLELLYASGLRISELTVQDWST